MNRTRGSQYPRFRGNGADQRIASGLNGKPRSLTMFDRDILQGGRVARKPPS